MKLILFVLTLFCYSSAQATYQKVFTGKRDMVQIITEVHAINKLVSAYQAVYSAKLKVNKVEITAKVDGKICLYEYRLTFSEPVKTEGGRSLVSTAGYSRQEGGCLDEALPAGPLVKNKD